MHVTKSRINIGRKALGLWFLFTKHLDIVNDIHTYEKTIIYYIKKYRDNFNKEL